MIIVMRDNATQEQIIKVEERLIDLGFRTHPITGDVKTVIGAIGDKRLLKSHGICLMPGVEDMIPIMKPYKLAGKELLKTPTTIQVGNVIIGGEEIVVMAGPCAIERKSNILILLLLPRKLELKS